MPPKGHDTPPTSPCRDLLMAELSAVSHHHHHHHHAAAAAAAAGPSAAIDLNGTGHAVPPALPPHPQSGSRIVRGRRRRSSLNEDDVGEEEMVNNSIMPMDIDHIDHIGQIGQMIGGAGHINIIGRQASHNTATSLHRHAPQSSSSPLPIDNDVSMAMEHSGDDADDGDADEDDSKKPAAALGLPPLPSAPSSPSRTTPSAATTSPSASPGSGLPDHFACPPPSAQCRRPRRSSLKKQKPKPANKENTDDDTNDVDNGNDSDDDQKIEAVPSVDDSAASTEQQSHHNFQKLERNLSFHSVEIRQYAQVLGDHPCCSAGPPISLGWEYNPNDVAVHNVDEYESSREPQRRKSRRDMKLDCDERREILSSVTVVKKTTTSSTTGTASDGDGTGTTEMTETAAYTSQDFRRAERRLYRERRVSSRKMNHFFSSVPSIDGGAPTSSASASNANSTAVAAETSSTTAETGGEARRHAFFAQGESGRVSPHHE